MNKIQKMSLKYKLALASSVVVSVLGVGTLARAYYGDGPKIVVEGNYIESAAQSPEPKLGAISSPDFLTNYFSVGGVRTMAVRTSMYTATTTLCSFQSPFSTTSTLEYFSYQITGATTTAATLVMATSTNSGATSTSNNLISAQSVPSGALGESTWNPIAGANGNILKSSDSILLKTEGAGLAGYTYTGTCQAIFRGF